MKVKDYLKERKDAYNVLKEGQRKERVYYFNNLITKTILKNFFIFKQIKKDIDLKETHFGTSINKPVNSPLNRVKGLNVPSKLSPTKRLQANTSALLASKVQPEFKLFKVNSSLKSTKENQINRKWQFKNNSNNVANDVMYFTPVSVKKRV